MKAWMLLALILPVAPLLTSCGDKEAVVEAPSNQSASVQSLISEANELSYSISSSSLLRSSTDRDKNNMISLVNKVKMAAMKLSLNPGDKVALQILIDSSNEYKTIQVMNSERPQFDKFFALVSEVIAETTGNIGGTYNLSSATLFSYSFSNGLAPFGSFASSGKWSTGVSLDVYSARVQGEGNKSWLVSPVMDLSKVVSPRIQIRHSIQNESRDGSLPSPGKIFKIKVSRTFEAGDPNKAKWEDLEIKKFPRGLDFHTIDSEEIDLGAYQNEKVTVAFVFDTKTIKVPRGRYGWTIEKFNLLGAGATPQLTVPNLIPVDYNSYVFKKDFVKKEDQNLNGFTFTSTTDAEVAFKVKTRGDNTYFAVGESKKVGNNYVPVLPVGEYYLTSKSFKVPTLNNSTSVEVSMKHVMNFCRAGKCTPEDVIKLQIAETADSAEDQEWESFEFNEFPTNDSGWDSVVSGEKGNVKVPQKFSGKDVQVRLLFKQTAGSTHTWQVYNIKLKVSKGK